MRSVFGVALVLTSAALAGCSGSDEGSSSGGSSSGTSSSSSSGGSSSGTTSSSSASSSSGGTKKEFGAQCKESAECKTDFCIFKNGGTIGMCTQTCDGEIDCPGLDNTCVNVSDAPQKVCVPK